MSINIATDISKEKLYAATKQQQKQSHEQKQEQTVKQDPNFSTGVQWAQSQAMQANQPQNVQKPNNTQNAQIGSRQSSPEILAPAMEDTAILSTAISFNEESAQSNIIAEKLSTLTSRMGLNISALEASFKEIFKKSKSHNLLLERFMTTVKLNGITSLLGLCGVDPSEIEQIKAQAREEALKEIDTKLSQDWAYTKAMLDITGAI